MQKTKEQKLKNRKSMSHKRTTGANFSNAKGITLIALVITIIVLLILASVAINLTLRRKRNIYKSKRSKNTN